MWIIKIQVKHFLAKLKWPQMQSYTLQHQEVCLPWLWFRVESDFDFHPDFNSSAFFHISLLLLTKFYLICKLFYQIKHVYFFLIIIGMLRRNKHSCISIFNHVVSCISLWHNFMTWKTASREIRNNLFSLKIVEGSTMISNL